MTDPHKNREDIPVKKVCTGTRSYVLRDRDWSEEATSQERLSVTPQLWDPSLSSCDTVNVPQSVALVCNNCRELTQTSRYIQKKRELKVMPSVPRSSSESLWKPKYGLGGRRYSGTLGNSEGSAF